MGLGHQLPDSYSNASSRKVPLSSPNIKHYLSLIIAAIFFGSIAIFAYYLTFLGVSSTQQAFFRILFSTFFLFCGVAVWHRSHKIFIKRKDLPLFVIYGLIGVCAPLFSYITAIAIGTPVVVAVSLAYLYPIITLGLARITLKESLTYRRLLAVVSSTAGAIIISAPVLFEYAEIPLLGVILSTLTAIFLAAFMVLGRNFSRNEKYHSMVTTFWAYFFGSLWMGIILLGLQLLVIDPRIVGFQLFLPIHAWLLLVCFALIATAIPYGLVNYGMKRVDASIASIVLLIDPLSSVILGIVLLGQTVTFLQVVGTTLILLGTIIVASKEESLKQISSSP